MLALGRGPARDAADRPGGAVVQHDAERPDVVAHRAVAEGARAGGVAGRHAAEGAFAVGRLGGDAPTGRGQPPRQVAVDDARLHANRVRCFV